jgi:hypothetical protein
MTNQLNLETQLLYFHFPYTFNKVAILKKCITVEILITNAFILWVEGMMTWV